MIRLANISLGLKALLISASVMAGPVVAQSSAPLLLDLTGLGTHDETERRRAVTLTRGVRSGRDLKTHELRIARDRMVKDQSVSADNLRALADAGDGIAALRLIKRLDAEGRDAAPANLAHYYGIAASTGRVTGLFGLVRTLERVDPSSTSQARLKLLKSIVVAYARAGNPVASAAMMRFHLAERPFGPMPDEITRLATSARGTGNAVIALQLAGELIQTGWENPAALAQAEIYLTRALKSESVRIKLIAGNFLPVLKVRIQTLSSNVQLAEADG